MTFSLVGRCARTGMLGAVVTSSSAAVAARCAWARARVGAVCTQSTTDPRLGPALLNLLADGRSATAALDEVVAHARDIAYRQVIVIDAHGNTASYSGELTLGRYASARGTDCAAAGNLLADPGVPDAMVAAFQARPQDELGTRLLAATRAALDAGGEVDDVRSSGMMIVDKVPWPVTDLRVDWHDDPITEIERIWAVWQPQAEAYVVRATNPGASQ